MQDKIEKAIAKTKSEIVRVNLKHDPTDPEISAKLCALNCKLYSLMTMLAHELGDTKAAKEADAMHTEWEKRRGQAEQIRKNRLLPQILAKLDEWQTGASAVKEHVNAPIFRREDEDID